MKYLWIMMVLLVSCGKGQSVKFYDAKEEDYKQFVNQKVSVGEPNYSLDKIIVNEDYPIELALYSDNRFYYNLPRLASGTGWGRWKYEDGYLKLHATRDLFDMNMKIRATDELGKDIAITFIDRFGPNVLKLAGLNL